MDVPAVNSRLKAAPALEMSQRLPEVLEDYLRCHRIEGSTEATVKFYAKELRLFLNDLAPPFQTIVDGGHYHIASRPIRLTEVKGFRQSTERYRWIPPLNLPQGDGLQWAFLRVGSDYGSPQTASEVGKTVNQPFRNSTGIGGKLDGRTAPGRAVLEVLEHGVQDCQR